MSHFYTHRHLARNFVILFVLSLVTLNLLTRLDSVQNYLSKAANRPAALIIDAQGVTGPLDRPWQYLAQGGESPDYHFLPVLGALSPLNPAYIRLDHLYDFYQIVSRGPGGELIYDWSRLDPLLLEIRSVRAIPFLVLSYMPPVLNASGDIIGAPDNWAEWSEVVKKTIEHVSGKDQLNIPNVYYEVWNEPDLFGGWKTYGAKNYLTLYHYAAQGATATVNTQAFKLGGPATTNLYRNWHTTFLDYVAKNQLRLDFYSWHLYSPDLNVYENTYADFDRLMRNYPAYFFKVEPIITEWGPTSEVSRVYDTDLSAAHLIATMAVLSPNLHKTFIFEFQDGLDPAGQEYWGRWGLLTHQAFGSTPKPRYTALSFLNRLGPNQLHLSGEGTFVKALASRYHSDRITLVIANYDPQNQNVETVPVTFQRLNPGKYELTTELLGRRPTTQTITITETVYKFSLSLAPNAVVYLSLRPQ